MLLLTTLLLLIAPMQNATPTEAPRQRAYRKSANSRYSRTARELATKGIHHRLLRDLRFARDRHDLTRATRIAANLTRVCDRLAPGDDTPAVAAAESAALASVQAAAPEHRRAIARIRDTLLSPGASSALSVNDIMMELGALDAILGKDHLWSGHTRAAVAAQLGPSQCGFAQDLLTDAIGPLSAHYGSPSHYLFEVHHAAGQAAMQCDDVASAEGHYRNALASQLRGHAPDSTPVAHSTAKLASCYVSLERPIDIAAMLAPACRVLRSSDDTALIGALRTLALSHMQRDDLENATDALTEAIAVSKAHSRQIDELTLTASLARVLRWRGQTTRASRLLTRALVSSILRLGADHAVTVALQAELGHTLGFTTDLELPRDLLRSALRSSTPPASAIIKAYLARLYWHHGDLTQARDLIMDSAGDYDRIASSESGQSLGEAYGHWSPFSMGTRIMLDNHDWANALALLDEGRGRLTHSPYTANATSRDVICAPDRYMHPHTAVIGWYEWSSAPLADRQHEVWAFVLRSTGVAWVQLPQAAPRDLSPVSLATSLSSAIVDTTWAAQSRDIHDRWFAPLRPLLTSITQLHVIPHSSPMVYVPMHLLVTGPAEPGRAPPLLDEQYTISYLPSLRALHGAQGEHRPFTSALIIAAPHCAEGTSSTPSRVRTQHHPQPEPLPDTLTEALAIRDTIPDSTLLLGTDAREPRVWDVLSTSARFDVIHIATHASVHANHPHYSALVLAPPSDPVSRTLMGDLAAPSDRADGLLYQPELADARFGSRLVVLSACQTGLGPVHTGEGMVGMANALLRAGATAVVVAHWNTDDLSSAIFMHAFYDRLRSEAPPHALRAARQHLRTLSLRDARDWCVQHGCSERATRYIDRRLRVIGGTGLAFPSPYYWGAFVLLGSGAGLS